MIVTMIARVKWSLGNLGLNSNGKVKIKSGVGEAQIVRKRGKGEL